MKHQIIQDHLRRIRAVEAANGEPIFTTPRSYIAAVDAYPDLDPQAEQDIARIGGADAHRILFTCNLTYAAKLAFAMRKMGQDAADMVSAANLGLWEAAVRFQPDRGAGFRTYAAFRIRAELLKHIAQATSVVSLGQDRTAKYAKHNLQGVKRELGFDGILNDEQAAACAERMGLKDAAAVKAIDVAQRKDMPCEIREEFFAACKAPGEDEDALVARLDAKRRLERLNAALAELSERDRSIFIGRRIANPQTTFAELADRFGITRERARQIEVAVVEKLRPVAGEQA